ncbi:MAG: SDR family oxidoreductase [Bacteroidota bacterium]
MVKEFENKEYWAVILGGSSGLGLASAIKLAAHGMHICIIHKNTRTELAEIEASFSEIKQLGVKLISFNIDLLNIEKSTAAINELAAQLGHDGSIRCLLHSVARGNLKPVQSEQTPALTTEDFAFTINNMAISLYQWTKELFGKQLFAEDARVLSFTSEGSKKSWKNYAGVSAAKAALEAITRSIALEMAPYGIRANCIQPGITETRSLKLIPGHEELISANLRRNPFKRLTTPQDVANVVYLLCKDEAAWINGAVIPVDGGEQIN